MTGTCACHRMLPLSHPLPIGMGRGVRFAMHHFSYTSHHLLLISLGNAPV